MWAFDGSSSWESEANSTRSQGKGERIEAGSEEHSAYQVYQNIHLHLQNPLCWPPDSLRRSLGSMALSLLYWLSDVVCCLAGHLDAYHFGFFFKVIGGFWLSALVLHIIYQHQWNEQWKISKKINVALPYHLSLKKAQRGCYEHKQVHRHFHSSCWIGLVSSLPLRCEHEPTVKERQRVECGLPAAQNPTLGKCQTAKLFVFH